MPLLRSTGRFGKVARSTSGRSSNPHLDTNPTREMTSPRRISDSISTIKATKQVQTRFEMATKRSLSEQEYRMISVASRSGNPWFMKANADGSSTLVTYRACDVGKPEASVAVVKIEFDSVGKYAQRVNERVKLTDLGVRDTSPNLEGDLRAALSKRYRIEAQTQVVNSNIAKRLIIGNRTAQALGRRVSSSSGPDTAEAQANARRARTRAALDSARQLAKTKTGRRVIGAATGLGGVGGLGTLAYLWLANDDGEAQFPEDKDPSNIGITDLPLILDDEGSGYARSLGNGNGSNRTIVDSQVGLANVAEIKRSIFEKNVSLLQQKLDLMLVENRRDDYREENLFEVAGLIAGMAFSAQQRSFTKDFVNYLFVLHAGMFLGMAPDSLYVSDVVKTLSSRAQTSGRSAAVPMNDLLAYASSVLGSVDLL